MLLVPDDPTYPMVDFVACRRRATSWEIAFLQVAANSKNQRPNAVTQFADLWRAVLDSPGDYGVAPAGGGGVFPLVYLTPTGQQPYMGAAEEVAWARAKFKQFAHRPVFK